MKGAYYLKVLRKDSFYKIDLYLAKKEISGKVYTNWVEG